MTDIVILGGARALRLVVLVEHWRGLRRLSLAL